MNRTISVSTDVFASIWSQRQNSEESEDAILRRVLGCAPSKEHHAQSEPGEDDVGFFDSRNGVKFPRGFTIFRTYKRKEFAAIAEEGHWRRLDDGSTYASLNQLNASIAAGNENVWNGNWKFKEPDGSIKSIDALRA